MIAESIEDFPEEIICQRCPPQTAKKPRSDFYITKRNRRGSTKLEIKPTCKRCKAEQARGYRRNSGTAKRLIQRKAPMNALLKMCEEHPEILADIVHRYRPVYEPFLVRERERLTRHMETVIQANINRRKYTFDNLENEYRI